MGEVCLVAAEKRVDNQQSAISAQQCFGALQHRRGVISWVRFGLAQEQHCEQNQNARQKIFFVQQPLEKVLVPGGQIPEYKKLEVEKRVL